MEEINISHQLSHRRQGGSLQSSLTEWCALSPNNGMLSGLLRWVGWRLRLRSGRAAPVRPAKRLGSSVLQRVVNKRGLSQRWLQRNFGDKRSATVRQTSAQTPQPAQRAALSGRVEGRADRGLTVASLVISLGACLLPSGSVVGGVETRLWWLRKAERIKRRSACEYPLPRKSFRNYVNLWHRQPNCLSLRVLA
ncbi:uncharacterized protein LY79DRAFT_311175 [Colletotrichum navitas]|uniref:Uncharacterized protein n=1 Tax=Colletotrichum navitas TaxID=681940 RepID=A0AAD8PT22_9PEZI|nr:uncharacterized protein LY79DRAFT_311175 [Colletotrichum navitas]KAK1580186.1 hypothetical protein LY79DRAFT_311175 [Colletotrichum navitas]